MIVGYAMLAVGWAALVVIVLALLYAYGAQP